MRTITVNNNIYIEHLNKLLTWTIFIRSPRFNDDNCLKFAYRYYNLTIIFFGDYLK